jgi:hypothetical protein
VEPRGIEPLTSALPGRLRGSAVVRKCAENRLFKANSHTSLLLLFVSIRPGHCLVTVKRAFVCIRKLLKPSVVQVNIGEKQINMAGYSSPQ